MINAGGLIKLHTHNNLETLNQFSEQSQILYFRDRSLFWNLEISQEEGNCLEKKADGLYASGTGGSGQPGAGMPSGGTTGQVLVKKSDDDYDTEWHDANFGTGGSLTIALNAILLAEDWDENNQQTLTFTGYDSRFDGVIGMPISATEIQKEAYALAAIDVIAQDDDEFTFQAVTVPEIDLPVTLFCGSEGSGGSSGGSGGHTIVDQSDTEQTQRAKLQFINADITDDENNDKTIVKLEKIQYASVPTASLANKGQIIQYTGQTTQDYKHGLFYECIEDTTTDPYEYSWESIGTQEFNDIYDKPQEADLSNVFSSGMPSNQAPVSGITKSKINYSTEEQVIGTWIDNKPLYQRVFTDITISSGAQFFTLDSNPIYELVVSHYLVGATYPTDGGTYGEYFYTTNDYFSLLISANKTSHVLNITKLGPRNYTDGILIVQYTKLTD